MPGPALRTDDQEALMKSRPGSALFLVLVLPALFCPALALAQCGFPQISCPDNITVPACDPGGAFVDYPIPTAENGCGPLSPSLLAGLPPGSLFPLGITVVTYSVSTAEGIISCSFSVFVTAAGVGLTCPDDIEVIGCDDGGAFVDYPVPTAESSCGFPLTPDLKFGPPPGGLFPFGTTTVGWEAVDQNGSFRTCSFRVTVKPPGVHITCPDDIEVTACDPGGAFVDYPVPTAESLCGTLTPRQDFGPPPGGLFPIGITTVGYTAADLNGHFHQCSFRVTVLPAAITMPCPEDIMVYTCDPAGAVVNYPAVTAETECGQSLETYVSAGLPSGSLFPPGTSFVTLTSVADINGSFSHCSFSVTVVVGDVEPPVITCPENQTVLALPGQTEAVVNYTVEAVDNCPGLVEVTCVPPSGSTLSCGTTTVTCTARDLAGNQSTCTFDVTVATPVAVDIMPGGCPNPLTTSDSGVISVAILGTNFLDPGLVDPGSVRLEGVAPVRWAREDAGAPYGKLTGKSGCLDCASSKKDRIRDLAFKFSVPDLVAALGEVTDGECRVLRLTGLTTAGCPIAGEDVVKIQRLLVQPATEAPPVVPATYALSANFPNPLVLTTRIHYQLPSAGHARLSIYDVTGRKVKQIVDEVQPAGRYQEIWDGTDANGVSVTSGVYFYALSVDGTGVEPGFREVRRMIVSR
jgi:hypothetical protein